MGTYFANALQCHVVGEYSEFCSPRYSRRLLKAQALLPASKSRRVQCLSEPSIARLIYAMGSMEPSTCSYSTAAASPSMQASQYTWSGRGPSATASQLGNTRIGGVASSARITNVPIVDVNAGLTPFRRSALIGPSLLDKSGEKLR